MLRVGVVLLALLLVGCHDCESQSPRPYRHRHPEPPIELEEESGAVLGEGEGEDVFEEGELEPPEPEPVPPPPASLGCEDDLHPPLCEVRWMNIHLGRIAGALERLDRRLEASDAGPTQQRGRRR